MSKRKSQSQKKRRSKRYTGSDAATGPKVTRIKAVKKSPLREWYEPRKQALRTAAIATFFIAAFTWLFVSFLTWAF